MDDVDAVRRAITSRRAVRAFLPDPVPHEVVVDVLAAAADGPLKGILGYEERPLVSVDYVNDPRSSIIDALSTLVIDDTQVKLYAWYDNEWGYVCRLMDIAELVARGL